MFSQDPLQHLAGPVTDSLQELPVQMWAVVCPRAIVKGSVKPANRERRPAFASDLRWAV
jgi:hypothetical protein